MNTPQNPIGPTAIIQKEKELVSRIDKTRQAAFTKFPLVFTLLGAFGLVATFYGFEGIIDRIDVLANNPMILLCTGITTLIFTGSLYKRLG